MAAGMAAEEQLAIQVIIQPKLSSEWNQETLKQKLKLDNLTPTITSFEATSAIQSLRTQLQNGLKGIKVDITAGSKSGSSTDAAAAEMTKLQASLSAAKKMADGFNTQYGTLLRTIGTTKGSVDSTVGPLNSMVNSYHELQKSIAAADRAQGEDVISFVQQVQSSAHAYQQNAVYATQYANALKQLDSAQQTLTVAKTNGFGNTEQVQALSASMEALQTVITEVEQSGGSMGEELSASLLTATDGVKNAQSSWKSASKSMTTDMSGVKQTMQDISNLMSSGGITDAKQVATLQGFNAQLQQMEANGAADTKALNAMNKQIEKMYSQNGQGGTTQQISAELAAAQKMMDDFASTYNSTMSKMAKGGFTESTSAIVQEYTNSYQNLQTTMKEAAETSKTAQEYLGKVADASDRFSKSSQHINQYNSAMKQLKTTQQEYNKAEMKGLDQTAEAQAMVTSMQQLQTATDQVKNAGAEAGQEIYEGMNKASLGAKEATANFQKASKDMTTDMSQVQGMIDQVNTLLASGNVTDPQQVATLTNFVTQLTGIQNQGVASVSTLKSIQKQIDGIAKEANPATSAVKGLVNEFKNMASSMLKSMLVRQVFQMIRKGINEVISTVKELDSAMTQLEIVTGASATELERYFDAAAESAKEYGASITDIVGSMETFARLGYNLQDSLNLTNTATLMSNVAATSVDEATTGLTSIVKAYGIEADEVESVADELIAVGQSYAISAEELMTAFEKGGAALAAANNSVEESIALFAAANASVQNANNVGTALRTTSARIRSATAELDEMGEEYDELVESTADYRAEIMALSGVDIMASEDQFKSTYTILKQIAEVWDDISDVSQAALLEDLAGKRNANVIMSVINNLQDLEGAYETANNAAGTATEANDIYMQSIEGRTAQLSATAEQFTEALDIEGLIKGVITAGTKLLDWLTKLTNAIGGLPGLIGAIGLAITGINIAKHIKSLGGLTKAFQSVGTGVNGALGAITVASAGISAALLAIGIAISAYQSYLKQLEEMRQAVLSASETYHQAVEDVNSYADEIAELKGILASNNVTEEQAYETRLRLIEIQDELNQAYGDEAGNLDLVAGSAQDAAVALENYTIALAKTYTNDPSNMKIYAQSVKELNNEISNNALISGALEGSFNLDSLNKILNAYDTLSTYVDSEGYVQLRASGTAQDIQADLLELSEWLDEHELEIEVAGLDEEDLRTAINDQLDIVSKTVDTWQATRDAYLQMQVVVNADSRGVMDQITAMADAAQQALLKDDYSNLDWTIFDVDSIKDQIQEIGKNDDQIAKYLQRQLDDIVDSLSTVWIQRDLENNNSYLSRLLAQYQQYTGQAAAMYAVLNAPDSGNASLIGWYNELTNVAAKYNVQVEDLVKTMTQLGYVTDDTIKVNLRILQDARDAVNQTVVGAYGNAGMNAQANGMYIGMGTYITPVINEDYVTLTNYANQLYELEEYMLKSDAGVATAKDFQNLTKTFPQLANETSNARTAVEKLYSTIKSDSLQRLQDMLDNIDSEQAREQLLDFMDDFLTLCDVVQGTSFKVDITAETESLQNFVTAVNESNSATGVSEQSVVNLKNRYEQLDSFDPQALFERTTNGVRLNTKEVQRLEKALKDQNHAVAQSNLEELQAQYYDLSIQIDNASSAAERSKLYAQRDEVLDEIEDVANLATRYEALTSAYNDYLNALNTTNEHDMYDTIISGYDDIEDMLARGWVTDEVRSYIDLFTNEDLGTASVIEVANAWEHLGDTIEGTTYSALDFFTYDDNGNSTAQGVENFYNAVKQVQTLAGQMWAYTDENGRMVLDLGVNGQQELAKYLGVDIDLVEILIRSMSQAGDFDVHISNWTDEYTQLGKSIESCTEYVQELLDTSGYSIDLNVNSTDLQEVQKEIEAVSEVFEQNFTDAQGNIKIDAQGVDETLAVLEQLYLQQEYIEHPMILSIDTTQLDEDAGVVVEKLQELLTKTTTLEADISAGVDTTWAISDLQNLITQIENMNPEMWADLGLDQESVDELLERIMAIDPQTDVIPKLDQMAIDELKQMIQEIEPEMLVQLGVDESLLAEFMDESEKGDYDVESDVIYNVVDDAVTKFMKQDHDIDDAVIVYTPQKSSNFDSVVNSWGTQTGTIYYDASTSSKSSSSTTTSASKRTTTAQAQGSAKANGDWSVGSSGTALVSELGPEMVVATLQPRRLATSGIINLFNCWDTLKVIKLQRRNEISPSANVTKVEKINHMGYGASLSLV